jgi:hypothetical protein
MPFGLGQQDLSSDNNIGKSGLSFPETRFILQNYITSRQCAPSTPPRTAPLAPSTMADKRANAKDGHVSPSPSQSISSSTASIDRTHAPPALKMSSSPDPRAHRGSFAEQMRGTPTSPRTSRQPSLTQQAMQELLNNPPTKTGDAKFQGRDWKTIRLGELVDPSMVRFAEYDTIVEDATSVSAGTFRPMQS